HADMADVAAWFVSESATPPSASDASWSTTVPTDYNIQNTSDWSKTVYVYVKDLAWNISPSRSATIILDRNIPTVNSLNLTGNAWAESGYTNTTNLSISTSASDNVGVTWWFISESSSAPAASSVTGSEPTSFTMSSWDWVHNIYIWSRDAIWNVSLVRSSSIILDTTINEVDTALTAVNQWDPVNQTITFNEDVKVISWGDLWGITISTTSSYSNSLNISWLASTSWLSNTNITLQDKAWNQKVINISLLVNEAI
ncbi:MAG: fibronectin, type III protein, partial [uncultured bacterium (gcode 4)]